MTDDTDSPLKKLVEKSMVLQVIKLEKKSMYLRKSLYAAVLLGMSLPVFAQGIVLNDESLRADLNWLNQQGVIQISTSTWPMSGDEIQRALSQAQTQTPAQQKSYSKCSNKIKI